MWEWVGGGSGWVVGVGGGSGWVGGWVGGCEGARVIEVTRLAGRGGAGRGGARQRAVGGVGASPAPHTHTYHTPAHATACPQRKLAWEAAGLSGAMLGLVSACLPAC